MTPSDFKATRNRLCLTQAEMGRRLGGYSLSAVYQWESGKRPIEKAVAKLMEEFSDQL
jgi:DNA-binding transcriptional regulator YiaG